MDQLIALSKIYRKSIDELLGQAKPSLLDYLADSQNFRNQYGMSSTNGGEDDGRKDS